MFKSVLIPVEVSSGETRDVLLKAGELAAGWGAEMHAVTVVPDLGSVLVASQFSPGFEAESCARAMVDLKAALKDAGIEAKPHVMIGTIYDRIIALADMLDIDLIVLGAHKPELKDYLLGSNASRLVRYSHRSVLVLRGLGAG